ncbi:hypothetical protein C8Q74DRAFT_431115 [Fomes fomentarius]|nr:hypothetical protein C8Q74DRAFT_431115 [Fomes fomentarius]
MFVCHVLSPALPCFLSHFLLSPSAVCLFSSARDSWRHAHWLPPFTLTITLANQHSAWTASGFSFPDVHPAMPRLFSARISQDSQRRTQSVHQHTERVQRLGGIGQSEPFIVDSNRLFNQISLNELHFSHQGWKVRLSRGHRYQARWTRARLEGACTGLHMRL